MTAHYDEDELYDYLDDPHTFARRAELEAHLGTCERCRKRLDELREFEAALSNTAVWDFADRMRNDDEPPESLRSVADLLATEDVDAELQLRALIEDPAAFRHAGVVAEPRLQTAGVVRRLCSAARDLRERQPAHALTFADAAVAIAEKLPRERYPEMLLRDVRGNAWEERANVLRYLGRYPEALDALDRAEEAYAHTPVAAFSIAIVQYVRAVVFFKMERLDEAMQLAVQAAQVFQQFGEDERFVHAKIVQSGVLFHQSRFSSALDLFLELVPVTKALDDTETLARLYANIANCYIGLEDRSSASGYFAQAVALYDALGLETEKIRTRWSLGVMLISGGAWREGVERLRQAKQEFEALGATSDAALVTLDIVETLLAWGERGDVLPLCTGLVESFTKAGMEGNALTALAFLREAAASGSATPILVRHLRALLQREITPF